MSFVDSLLLSVVFVGGVSRLMLGDSRVVCATVSPPTAPGISQCKHVQCSPPLSMQLPSVFGNFSNGISHVTEIITAGSNPDVRWNSWHGRQFASAPTFWLQTIRCQSWQCARTRTHARAHTDTNTHTHARTHDPPPPPSTHTQTHSPHKVRILN